MKIKAKQNLMGWLFLAPAGIMIILMAFVPVGRALYNSFHSGAGSNMNWVGTANFTRMFQDRVFMQALRNNFFYLIIQVPIMIILGLVLATMLNNPKLKFRGVFRTAIFLPSATALVAYSIIFRSLFATDGFINSILVGTGILESNFNFFGDPTWARIIIILGLVWRWTGFNMVFYLAGLQNIDYSTFEAAKIDGANSIQTFFKVTIPQLKPVILMTTIMSTNGTLQLFDESVNLTNGGPGVSSITMSHHIFNQTFGGPRNFGYASALSFVILIIVAILALIQMKVGDSRD